ncbi:hypothetical protein D3C75_855370 [compost metagenome]
MAAPTLARASATFAAALARSALLTSASATSSLRVASLKAFHHSRSILRGFSIGGCAGNSKAGVLCIGHCFCEGIAQPDRHIIKVSTTTSRSIVHDVLFAIGASMVILVLVFFSGSKYVALLISATHLLFPNLSLVLKLVADRDRSPLLAHHYEQVSTVCIDYLLGL